MKGLENPLLPANEGENNPIRLKTVKKTNKTTTAKQKSLRQLAGGPNVSWFSDRHLLARTKNQNPASGATDIEEQLAEPRSHSDQHIRHRKRISGNGPSIC